MKLFGAKCDNLHEAEARGLFVNLLATLAVPHMAYEIFTVEEGNLDTFVNGNNIPLEGGATIIMEPGDRHKMVNRGSEDAILIETRLNVCEGDRHSA